MGLIKKKFAHELAMTTNELVVRQARISTNFLFPSFCALCDTSLISANEIKYGLCDECREGIKIIEGEKCSICGRPLISESETCLSCRSRTGLPYDRLWVLFPYTGKYHELLTQYKFNKKLALANFFAELIINIINKNNLSDAVIVPVPPRPGKIFYTGWDQVDNIVKKINKPVLRCLKRKKSQVQKELNREDRINNLKGKIYCNGKAPKTALIIDDVITTGSTMEVCASILKESGAKTVYCIALFFD